MAWLPMQTSQLQAPILPHPGGIAGLHAYIGSKVVLWVFSISLERSVRILCS